MDTDDFELDDLFPLSEVPDRIPAHAGRKFHRSTVFRWAARGAEGKGLRTTRVGRTLCTTERWLKEFFLAASGVGDSVAVGKPDRPQKKMRRESGGGGVPHKAETDEVLRRLGLSECLQEGAVDLGDHRARTGAEEK